jgi:hypothetical protein
MGFEFLFGGQSVKILVSTTFFVTFFEDMQHQRLEGVTFTFVWSLRSKVVSDVHDTYCAQTGT